MKLYRNMTLTGAGLRAAGACIGQANRVDELWPEGAALTLDNLRTAVREGLDLGWLARRLPPPALRAYREAIAPARRAYDEAVVAAWRAWRAYDEATDAARRAYDEAIAAALWAALPEEGTP